MRIIAAVTQYSLSADPMKQNLQNVYCGNKFIFPQIYNLVLPLACSTRDHCSYLAVLVQRALSRFTQDSEQLGSIAIFLLGREFGWSITAAADSIILGWRRWLETSPRLPRDIKVTRCQDMST
jgi:hypothetical protein